MSRYTTTRRTRASSALSLTALAISALGCAGYGPGNLQSGATQAQISAQMGEPRERRALADGGTRLDYARGPMGRHTYRLELDAAGHLRAIAQLLTEPNFDGLPLDVPAADVRDRLGPPSETRVGWRGVGEVWSYRYESLFCRWFQVWLVDGRVREAAYATDPACDEARRFDDN
jgi:hypothetical protein